MGIMRLALCICVVFVCVRSDSLQVGTSVNGQLAHVEDVKLSSIPLTTRTKNVFYNGNVIIKGISAIDLTKTKAVARVTAGGVGSTFVNIKLKSERGEQLNFQVQCIKVDDRDPISEPNKGLQEFRSRPRRCIFNAGPKSTFVTQELATIVYK